MSLTPSTKASTIRGSDPGHGSAAVSVAALTGVSCTSPGNREAVGYFAVAGENLDPMAVPEVHGS